MKYELNAPCECQELALHNRINYRGYWERKGTQMNLAKPNPDFTNNLRWSFFFMPITKK
jgi:hypothetical protein